MNWKTKVFDALTLQELYDILRLRNEVFVVEQHCPYQDLDNADQRALHLMGTDNNGYLLAYTRLFAPGIQYAEACIGRGVTSPLKGRGKGIGRELMERSIAEVENHFGMVPIMIGAQEYLHRFYSSLGFKQVSDIYLEDGIPHIKMLREVR